MSRDVIKLSARPEDQWVIVNRYAEAMWSDAALQPLTFPARALAQKYADRWRRRLPKTRDDNECVVMTHAQFLVEYGQ